jgi:hypothetical protein
MRRKKAVPQFGVPGALPRKVRAGQRPEPNGRRSWGSRESVTTGFLILMMIVCMGILWWMAKAEGSAEGEVRRYLTYLAQGDAEGALSMVDPGVPNEQRLFLTNEVMASASSRLVIESVEPEPTGAKRVDTMSVTATLRLNGDRFTHVFQVDRKDREDSIVDRWVIREGLFVTVPVSGVRVPSFSVGGVSAPTGQLQSDGVGYLFFPGVYSFEPAGLGPYVTAQPAHVVVEDGAYASDYETKQVTFDGSLSGSLRAEVLTAMQKAVQKCATWDSHADASCPAEVRSSTLSSLELVALPSVLSGATDDGHYEADDAVIRYQDTGGWFPDRNPHDLTVRVQATVNMNADGIPEVDIDGKPRITVTMRKR